MSRKSRVIYIGGIPIGGGNPVVVQSMTNTNTRKVKDTLDQIEALTLAGCEIVRLAVPDETAARALVEIKKKSPIPLIADIHFNHNLALMALDAGIDALRINPGNIGGEEHIDAVVKAAKSSSVPIRIGVNSGSVEKDLLAKFGGPTPEAMVESALRHVKMLEDRNFYDLKISLKSSSVMDTIHAYNIIASRCEYPLHIGITEAGTLLRGSVKSSVGLGVLLYQGIGDTMRVSLTHEPVKEIEVAWEILRSIGLRSRGPEIISCPTCGRTEIDLIGLAQSVEESIKNIKEEFTVAVMGCVVNGPGEAKEADVGIAGGRGKGIIFRKGERVKTVTGDTTALTDALLEEINSFLKERASF